MPLILYYTDPSPPARAVRMLLKALGLDFEIKNVDLLGGEQNSENYIKLNPQRQVPVLDDNGFVLSESRAILTYLVNQYGKDDDLYPKDPKKRAVVDRLLYFDCSTLFPGIRNVARPIIFFNRDPGEEAEKNLRDAVGILESYLSNAGPYLAGSKLTIADLSSLANVLAARDLGVDLSQYPKTEAWSQKLVDELPYFHEANDSGIAIFQKLTHRDNIKKNE